MKHVSQRLEVASQCSVVSPLQPALKTGVLAGICTCSCHNAGTMLGGTVYLSLPKSRTRVSWQRRCHADFRETESCVSFALHFFSSNRPRPKRLRHHRAASCFCCLESGLLRDFCSGEFPGG